MKKVIRCYFNQQVKESRNHNSNKPFSSRNKNLRSANMEVYRVKNRLIMLLIKSKKVFQIKLKNEEILFFSNILLFIIHGINSINSFIVGLASLQNYKPS